ncbi:MAG: hypothetical protein LBU99_04005 [Spirochaetaceae bacterium]|jgi:hypothetical protein|nr:hypothetical protein [Spirochaetaceae bacterium]
MFYTGCSRGDQGATAIQREPLFLLNYGRFEDEIDLFDIDSMVSPNTYLYMQDGIVYVTNGKTKKIIQFTSYGGVLSVFYNPETNPTPSFVSQSAEDGVPEGTPEGVAVSTQRAIPYYFNTLGPVTVDSRKYMYVIDQLPQERHQYDQKQNLLLREVVLRFANDGSYIDYLGQEGPGGTPFSAVRGIYSTNASELIVVSQTMVGLTVNWFSPEGILLYTIPVENRGLPSPFAASENVNMAIDTIIPDYTARRLYLKIDYYRPEVDASSNVQAGISYTGSYIYPLDVETGLYGEGMNIPVYETIERSGLTQVSYSQPYEFLGVTENGWFFFIIADVDGYMVQMLERDTGRVIRKQLDVRADEVMYNTFSLSREGIICGLLASDYEASVVWWRTDSLTGGSIR